MVQLQDFSGNQLVCRLGEDYGNVPFRLFDNALHGLGKHIVANENGYLGAPFLVCRLLPATDFGVVDDVVVNKACAVQQFNARAGVGHPVNVNSRFPTVGNKAKQGRPDAFPFFLKQC